MKRVPSASEGLRGDDPKPQPFRWRKFGLAMGLRILVDDIEQFLLDAHVPKVDPELLADRKSVV